MVQRPTAIVCVGMAGSGKTTFMQRINSHLHSLNEPPYVMNLDPAVRSVPFDTNIDIRDSINYKEVMSQYNLGPNGGILTSLNLFATKVDQILAILEKRCNITTSEFVSSDLNQSSSTKIPSTRPIQNILVDTPGQIEVFVWSASGQILLSSLASSFPTVLAYIIDTPRTASTSTFMSNMLYACSILYKTKLPMILVFNKTDVQSADFAKEWMTDFEAFQAALQREEETGRAGGAAPGLAGPPVGGGSGYMGSLLNSMSLVLDEFYRHLSVVGVSSVTGAGINDFFVAVAEKSAEFDRDYLPELERRRKKREDEKDGRREKELGKLMKDLNVEASRSGGAVSSAKPRNKDEPETISDIEDDNDDDDYNDESNSEDEDGEVMDMGDSGLKKRYREAVAQENNTPSADDLSFARYIRKSNINEWYRL